MVTECLPIGIEDFEELIEKECYCVGRTMFIKSVLEGEVVLHTRPRWFGKTLNINTLYYFFSIKQKGDAYLFNSLNIMKRYDTAEYLNKYPVLIISLRK